MDHKDSIKKANEHAVAALERMRQEGLPPTPQNYELWFVFYAQTHPELNKVMASVKKFTQQECEILYDRFIGSSKESEQVKQAGNKIQETIKNVNSMVSSVREASTKYTEALSEASTQLGAGDIDKEKLEQVVNSMMANTQEMVQQNAALEQQLAQSSKAVQDLQRDLEAARKEAMTDSLTKIANRKAFDAHIHRVQKEADAEEKTFSIILMDIDYFKSFNDNYGHQVGDQVLRLVAQTLVEGVKGRDIAARYGGEEFAIILPETNVTAAQMVGDQLRRAVANKEIINRTTGEKLGRITLSGGCAEYKNGESLENLIERADAALYSSKHNGRNLITCAPAAVIQKKSAT